MADLWLGAVLTPEREEPQIIGVLSLTNICFIVFTGRNKSRRSRLGKVPAEWYAIGRPEQ
jgi:hypothetical protein